MTAHSPAILIRRDNAAHLPASDDRAGYAMIENGFARPDRQIIHEIRHKPQRHIEVRNAAQLLQVIAVEWPQKAAAERAAVIDRLHPRDPDRIDQPIGEPLVQLAFQGIVVGAGGIHHFLNRAQKGPGPARRGAAVVGGAGRVHRLVDFDKAKQVMSLAAQVTRLRTTCCVNSRCTTNMYCST